jgi:hypothetical protein
MIDVYDGKPIVLIPDVTTDPVKPRRPDMYHGEILLQIEESGDEYVFGNEQDFNSQDDHLASSVALYNKSTGIVKEINPKRTNHLTKRETLSQEDRAYLQLTALNNKFFQLSRQLRGISALSLDLDNSDSPEQDPTRLKAALADTQEKIKQALLSILGPKKYYALKDHEQEAMKDYYRQHPTQLLEAIHTGLDPIIPALEDGIVEEFLPELWNYEEVFRIAKMGTYSPGNENSFGSQSRSRHDSVLDNTHHKIRGGNAKEQFSSSSKLFGTVKNHTQNGIVDSLLLQDKNDWKTFAMPPAS